MAQAPQQPLKSGCRIDKAGIEWNLETTWPRTQRGRSGHMATVSTFAEGTTFSSKCSRQPNNSLCRLPLASPWREIFSFGSQHNAVTCTL
eukprot:1932254-Amphidinium_carterae.1